MDIKFSINKYDLLFLEARVSLFDFSLTLSLMLSQWRLSVYKKTYLVAFFVGPLLFKVVDLNKMYEYIDKVLRENEDKFSSNS